jgi:hypothetical protein
MEMVTHILRELHSLMHVLVQQLKDKVEQLKQMRDGELLILIIQQSQEEHIILQQQL